MFATQQQNYGRVMFLMLPTTSLWKSYVLNVATQQLAYAILAYQRVLDVANNELMEKLCS